MAVKKQSCSPVFCMSAAAAPGLGRRHRTLTKVLWSFEGQTLKVLSESTQIRSLQETKNRQSSCLVLPM